MNKQQVGYLITIALIILTGIVSISTAKQPTASIYTGFDVTHP